MHKEESNPFILALKARNLTVEIHHHSAYQIVLSNDNPFNSTLDEMLHEQIHGFVIKPHVRHFCVAEKGTLNVLNIDPYYQYLFDVPVEANTSFSVLNLIIHADNIHICESY
jgi:hypothetical protein